MQRKIALGGMAEIWGATWRSSENGDMRQVAVKVLQAEYAHNQEFQAMFWDEVRISKRLRHANIVEVYDGHEIDNYLLQSMELLEGLDLRKVLSKSTRLGLDLPIPLVLYIGQMMARGLSYAHMRRNEKGEPMNIVHRDISPHNVMIGADGQVKLLDFGIAKAAERLSRTRQGVVKGKVAYMSPEQAMATEVDGRTDIFAMGIVLWEALAMQRLFKGENDAVTLQAVLKAEAPQLTQVNRRISQEVNSLVTSMLSKAPKDRPATMQQVEKSLRRALMKNYPEDEGNSSAVKDWMERISPKQKVGRRTAVLESSATPAASGSETVPDLAPPAGMSED